MNVTFACPQCDQAARVHLDGQPAEITCPNCNKAIRAPADAWDDKRLRRCLVCPSTDLFVRKDFPQRLGVGLVVLGILGSSIAWAYTLVILTFAILFATALADVVLYLIVGDALMCYRCNAQYRNLDAIEGHEAFDLETHERYRQIAARAPQGKQPQPENSSAGQND